MKTQKGITVASLLIYVVAMGIIVSIIAIVLSFYNKNVTSINDTGDVSLELNKFETKMISETQTAGNRVTEVTTNTIKFKSGNTYTFVDERIYQNEIVVSNYVKEFSAKLETDGDKQLLRIYIVLEKGQAEIVKNLNYTINSKAAQTQDNQLTRVVGSLLKNAKIF